MRSVCFVFFWIIGFLSQRRLFKQYAVVYSLFHTDTGKTYNFLSPQFEKGRKSEVTKTSVKSGLEPDQVHWLKSLQSIHLGCLRVDKCRWKEIDETISVTATEYLSNTALASVRNAQRRSFRFVLLSRETVVNELIFLGYR